MAAAPHLAVHLTSRIPPTPPPHLCCLPLTGYPNCLRWLIRPHHQMQLYIKSNASSNGFLEANVVGGYIYSTASTVHSSTIARSPAYPDRCILRHALHTALFIRRALIPE